MRPRVVTAAACLTPTWNPPEPLRPYGALAETKAGILPPGSGICAAWLIYWYGLYPVHWIIFRWMLKGIARRAVS